MSTKEKVLAFLSQSKNSVSGQEIANQLGISRTAVWKAINTLREEGYQIHSQTKQGYRLLAPPNQLSESAIKQYLDPSIGKVYVESHDLVGSTNDEVKRIIQNLNHEIVIVASQAQSQGKGRLGREFYSPRSGLYFSFGWRNYYEVVEPGLITIAAGVATSLTFEKLFNKKLTIKWVNDLQIEGRKVGGILTEGQTNLETRLIDSLICGIGLNLFQPEDGFPGDIENRALAIFDQDQEVDLNQLLAEIINYFFFLREKDSKYILDLYRERCETLGKTVTFTYQGQDMEGQAVAIDDEGALQIQLNNGEVLTLAYGEVSVKAK